MKRAFAITGLALALFAVPAAAHADIRIGITLGQGISNILTPANYSSSHSRGWSYSHDYSGYRAHKGRIMPLANVVREVERRSGIIVTDIRLSRDQKYYEVEGRNRQNRLVTTRASATTGIPGKLNVSNKKQHYGLNARSVTALLAGLRNEGYQNFDLVTLREENGVYQVRGLNKKGKPVMVRVQAKNGRVLSARAAPGYNGPSYARAEHRDFRHWQPSLVKQRYSGFTNIVAFDDYYALKARDSRGRPVSLAVCAFTGKILDTRY